MRLEVSTFLVDSNLGDLVVDVPGVREYLAQQRLLGLPFDGFHDFQDRRDVGVKIWCAMA